MATREEIRNEINNRREDISTTLDQISDRINKKVNVKERIKDNPYNAILIAAGAGFALATMTTPFGRTLLTFATRSAIAAAGAYMSKKGMKILTDKVMK